MKKQEILDIKKQQILALINMPYTKEEKVGRIAKILNKTDEEIIEETRTKKSLKADLEEVYKCLFKREGEQNENQKSK